MPIANEGQINQVSLLAQSDVVLENNAFDEFRCELEILIEKLGGIANVAADRDPAFDDLINQLKNDLKYLEELEADYHKYYYNEALGAVKKDQRLTNAYGIQHTDPTAVDDHDIEISCESETDPKNASRRSSGSETLREQAHLRLILTAETTHTQALYSKLELIMEGVGNFVDNDIEDGETEKLLRKFLANYRLDGIDEASRQKAEENQRALNVSIKEKLGTLAGQKINLVNMVGIEINDRVDSQVAAMLRLSRVPSGHYGLIRRSSARSSSGEASPRTTITCKSSEEGAAPSGSEAIPQATISCKSSEGERVLQVLKRSQSLTQADSKKEPAASHDLRHVSSPGLAVITEMPHRRRAETVSEVHSSPEKATVDHSARERSTSLRTSSDTTNGQGYYPDSPLASSAPERASGGLYQSARTSSGGDSIASIVTGGLSQSARTQKSAGSEIAKSSSRSTTPMTIRRITSERTNLRPGMTRVLSPRK